MKLLFDENLSPRLPARVADLFPGSSHVRAIGMARAMDSEIWNHAAQGEFVIVSKDDDFRQLAMLRGAPPKVVWLQVGNASTTEIERILRQRYLAIESFVRDSEASFLMVRGFAR